MKKITIIFIAILIIFVSFSNCSIVNAAKNTTGTDIIDRDNQKELDESKKQAEKEKSERESSGLWAELQSMASGFIDKGQNGSVQVDETEISNIFIPIFQVMITLANIVLTVVTAIMGIKYMVSNPDNKAKLKQQLIGLVVSMIVIWGAQGIWALMYNFLKDI